MSIWPEYVAHGALGPYDEVIYLMIAAVFISIMGAAWVKSRNTRPDFDETPESPDESADPDAGRFPLE